MLFVPSFSTAGVTLGFQIFQKLTPGEKPSYYYARTVRDDINGIMLKISNQPSRHLLEFSYAAQITPATREHVQMIFHIEPFRNAVVNGIAHDSDEIQNSLVFCFYSYETSVCALCTKQNVPCTCSLSLKRKIHPLDYETELHNMKSYFGSFDYCASAHMFDHGHARLLSRYSGKTCSAFTHDHLSQIKLSQWAMFNAANSCPINLKKLIIPDQPRPQFHRVNVDSLGNGKELIQAILPLNDLIDLLTDEADQSNIDDALFDWDSSAQFLDGFSEVPVRTPTIPPADLLPNTYDQESPLLMPAERNEKSVISDMSCEREVQTHFRQTYPEERVAMDFEVAILLATPANSNPASLSCVSLPPSPKLAVSYSPELNEVAAGNAHLQAAPSPQNTADITAIHNVHLAKNQRLAILAPAGETADEVVQRQHLQYDIETQRRIEMKKQRNREAAHLSNFKKKKRIEKMKAEIDISTKREIELRKLEKQLRSDNLLLRKALTAAGVHR